ncbi:MAG TPA: DUF4349 domain-containing protein [Nocardioidaceae bacterium]|nr:DUF4349 domain-containing protein [Nocardioidaceae bacterium]
MPVESARSRSGGRRASRMVGLPGMLVGALVGVLALVAGCSGGADSVSADMTEAGGVDAGIVERGLADADEAAAQSTGGTAGSSSGAANRPVVQTRAVIRRGEVVLVTKEVNRARTEVDDLLASLGGYLASEDTFNDRSGRPERSVLVIRVPEPAFDEAMRALAGIGRTERTDRRSKDVTTEVIDVDTRVATQEASLARLQRFLRQASDVDDMIRLESEIATRQGTLESLLAQQKYLSDQTSMSTITVRLRTPASPPPQGPAQEAGFLVGLTDGWAALKTVLVAGATVAGMLLPFLVTLALLGVPLWLLVRAVARRRGSTAPAVPPTPEAS